MSKERGGCDCLATVGEGLAGDGHYLQITMGSLFGNVDRPVFPLRRKDNDCLETRRNKNHYLAASFCPFCGLAYPKPEPEPTKPVAAPA
jgi:hypothetical protein